MVDGSFAYLANNRQSSGLVVVDIGAPAAPHVVARYHHESTIEVVVWDGLALLGDAAGVLQVIDVQQPAQPRLLGALALPGVPHRLAVLPPYVLVASGTAGLHVVDLTQPSLPQLRTTVPIAGQALDIALTGHMAYIAAMEGGFRRWIAAPAAACPRRAISSPRWGRRSDYPSAGGSAAPLCH